jgi:hypothetical protein
MRRLSCFVAMVLGIGLYSSAFAENVGIVSSVTKAPVSPDGLVSGRPTEMVIHFDISLDPKVPGRTLLKGKTIKFTLPDDFDPGEFPRPIGQGGPGGCNLLTDCNTAVLLQGWPQTPIPPPDYALSYDGTHTIVFTANKDLVPSVLAPGIKQSHLIIRGFTNPRPGHYPILVEAETGLGGALEMGIGDVHIIPKTRPNLNVTSVFDNPARPRLNKIYQETHPGELIPLTMDFLMWDRSGEPLLGVEIVALRGGNSDALLVQGKRTVGHVMVDTPAGAIGQAVFTTEPSRPVNSPVTGFPTALLQAGFRAGSATGEYVLTFSLTGGNSVEMHVLVN